MRSGQMNVEDFGCRRIRLAAVDSCDEQLIDRFAKLDCRFKYILSYKLISFNSKKKEYIRTFKYFKYIYLIHLNPFSFKVYKTEISEY